MTFYILTLFPQIFDHIFDSSILKRAQEKRLVKTKSINIRDFSKNSYKTVDDKPYGGGAGMVMKPDILVEAVESVKEVSYKILLSASGRKYDQKMAKNLSAKKSITLVCGHYEGVDTRVEKFVDDTISIGDFVLTGGEIAAAAIVDSVSRLIPGVIAKDSLLSESFSRTTNYQLPTASLLEYPQYTRPENFRGIKVPKVLLSGDHKKIEAWRKEQSIKRTKKFRPDLLQSK